MRRTTRWAIPAVLSACLIALSGCVTSNSSRYQHQMTAVMNGEPTHQRGVAAAAAAGLDRDLGVSSTMVANVPDQ